MNMKIVVVNLIVFAGIYAFYCGFAPMYLPDFRSYLPLLAGCLVAGSWSYRVVRHRGTSLLMALGYGTVCAFVVAAVSIAAIIATRGS